MTPDELNAQGNVRQSQGNFSEAQRLYERAVRLDPNHLPALANLATVLSSQNKLEAATAILYRITSQAPNDADQHLALGNVLMRQNKLFDCMPPLMRALELRPENPDVHINLAAVAYRQRKYGDSENSLRHVLSLGQIHHSIYFDLAHVKLAQGDLTYGLELYEHRWNTLVHSPAWDFHIPEWKGEGLQKSHLLIHAEQGFGDMIMLSRFIPWIKAKKITLAVHKSMVKLYQNQLFDLDDIIDFDDLSDDANTIYDVHTPMFSMMRWLRITKDDIDSHAYMVPPPDGPTVPKTGRINVGICWASGNHGDKYTSWRRRVTDLKIWLPLAEMPKVQLWSLQRDTGTSDIAAIGAGGLITDVMPSVESWADTAKLVSELDLVISVDTGVAHLAGALGTPCWMLSQRSPCWRWWNIEDETGLPWYEDFRIFWRAYDEHWEKMIADCCFELGKLSNRRLLALTSLKEEV